MIVLTLTRTELGLADLVIDSSPFTGSFHINEEGIGWPRFPKRRTFAPASSIVDGEVLLSVVTELGTMPATIYAQGSTMALLNAARAELDAAVGQSAYEVTLAVDGEDVGTWDALPESPEWGPIDSGMVRARMARASVTFSLQPGVA